MSRFVRGTRGETSADRSRRTIGLVTVIAMLGFAGFILADTGNHRGTKVVPINQDVKAKKAKGLVTADGEATSRPATNSGHAGSPPFAVPSNDDCAGAIVIPDGPYPVVTAPIDITDATPKGSDEGIATCAAIDATVWYSFTPSVTGGYVLSTCAGNGATGSNVYDTVIAVFDSSGGTCPEATSLGCNDTAVGCVAAVPGAPYVDQSTVSVVLTAGSTYFVVAGHWADDVANGGPGIGPGLNEIAIKVELSAAPDNDTCSSPTPLALDRIVFGTTASATNDYRSTPNGCFTGVGQIPSTSNGLDVVFSFVPPADGSYSFRYVQDDAASPLRGQSPVLYLADDCPAPDPTGLAPPHCLFAANRMNDQLTGNGNRSEEIKCVPLTGGTPYYLFFDDRFTGNPGGPLAVEVTQCTGESEPNDSIATATPFAPNSGCFMEGSSVASGPAADIDFFDLGTPPAGSKIFVGVDGAAANQSDFEMRITNTTDTLGYDDNDGTSWTGSNAPIITGVFADGNPIYVRIDGKPVVAGNEPYSLFARIESGAAENEQLPDPTPAAVPSNDTFYGAGHMLGGGFVKGIIYGWDTVSGPTDIDCFKFIAHEGDNIVAFSDNNPTRVGGTITNVWPVIRTIDGNPTPANTRFVGQVLRNIQVPSPGTLTGTSPSVTSNFMHYRARYTGAYAICYEPTQDTTTENPLPAAYPLPYQGSVSLNCGAVPSPTPADVAIEKVGPVGTAKTGDVLEYTVTVTNNDATGVAQDVRLVDTLPPELTFVALTVDDGFDGFNTGCLTLPTPGLNDDAVDCTNYSIAAGASVTYTLAVQVNNCIGAGIDVVNTASITSFTTDANATNDSATWTFTTTEDGSCNDLLCDPSGCIVNGCTVNDHCVAGGACVSDPKDCDDNNFCTDDSCDPTDPALCINDSTLAGDLCNDGNACTGDTCDPALFCVFPPAAAGVVCDDFLNCTTPDQCDGLGNCLGQSVCDDGNPCTDDFGDEGNACACTNDVSFAGTMCDDNNACTTGEVCDGLGGTIAHCNGGAAATAGTLCSDDNDCTTGEVCDGLGGAIANCNGGAPAGPGTTCSDDNACTVGEVCDGLGTPTSCNAGAALDCNDSNACTDDSCDPATGCVNGNNTSACDDGDFCTSGDVCSGGSCSGVALNCDDNNPCTDDSCVPGTGCVNTDNTAACSDGDACTAGDACGGGVCVGGASVICNDNNVCTTDTCDSATGCGYTNNTNACDDGSVCTTGDVCAGGSCGGAAIVCDDANPCTTDTCDPAAGCAFTNNTSACDDGSACTTGDLCGGGVCLAGAPVICNDDNVCTTDTCTPATGCAYTNNTSTCDDGNACTTGEVCGGGVCAGATPVICNDNNACTTDSCTPATGCVYTNNTNPCDDGSACTTGDICGGGVCDGAPLICSDGNACTTDSCAPATGCVYTNNTSACNDGNACTTGDICGGGVCAGASLICNDGNTCTTDSCAPATGCVYTNNSGACNDGNACTQTDVCSAGVCVGGNPVVCVASDSCHTVGTCVVGTGLCSNPSTNFDATGFSQDRVDGRDLVVLAEAWTTCPNDPSYDPAADLDQVPCVDMADFHLFMNSFGQDCP